MPVSSSSCDWSTSLRTTIVTIFEDITRPWQMPVPLSNQSSFLNSYTLRRICSLTCGAKMGATFGGGGGNPDSTGGSGSGGLGTLPGMRVLTGLDDCKLWFVLPLVLGSCSDLCSACCCTSCCTSCCKSRRTASRCAAICCGTRASSLASCIESPSFISETYASFVIEDSKIYGG